MIERPLMMQCNYWRFSAGVDGGDGGGNDGRILVFARVCLMCVFSQQLAARAYKSPLGQSACFRNNRMTFSRFGMIHPQFTFRCKRCLPIADDLAKPAQRSGGEGSIPPFTILPSG